jgi:tight adherence protein C
MLLAPGLVALLGSVLVAQPALAPLVARGKDAAALTPLWLRVGGSYRRRLRAAGRRETLGEFLREKALFALALAVVPLLPVSAASGRLPSPGLLLPLALVGLFVPDLRLRAQLRRRQEELFLALPDALSLLSLSLRSGQSLPQALRLAARETAGPLGEELAAAATLARRSRGHDERSALMQIAADCQEPHLLRFAELLAGKESPYAEFLADQAASLRQEQDRYLEQAAERAYLAMHLPVAPLLAVLVLLLTYGFLHTLATSP